MHDTFLGMLVLCCSRCVFAVVMIMIAGVSDGVTLLVAVIMPVIVTVLMSTFLRPPVLVAVIFGMTGLGVRSVIVVSLLGVIG